jgi:membrane associated rhomboid family serine protease
MPAARSALGAPISAGAPVVTITAIGLCVVAFVAQQVTGGQLTWDWMFAPAAVWHQPWRIVTAAFLHGGVLHLAFNMYALWVVGSFMEQLFGRSRLAALYLGSALGGHALILAYFRVFDFTDQAAYSGTVGASGAVFGLFAAALMAGRRLGSNINGIVGVIGLNLVLSFTVPNISWQGHVGGLLVGGAMAWAYIHVRPDRRRRRAWVVGVTVPVVVALIVFLTASPWSWSLAA